MQNKTNYGSGADMCPFFIYKYLSHRQKQWKNKNILFTKYKKQTNCEVFTPKFVSDLF